MFPQIHFTGDAPKDSWMSHLRFLLKSRLFWHSWLLIRSPAPTEDSTLKIGASPKNYQGSLPKANSCSRFLLAASKWLIFVEEECTTALQIDKSADLILHREHPVGICCSFDAKKKETSCIFDFIQFLWSSWSFHTSILSSSFILNFLTIAKVQKPQSHIKWVPRHWVTPHQRRCLTSFRDKKPCAVHLRATSAECGRNAGSFEDLDQSQYEPAFSSKKLSFFSREWNQETFWIIWMKFVDIHWTCSRCFAELFGWSLLIFIQFVPDILSTKILP